MTHRPGETAFPAVAALGRMVAAAAVLGLCGCAGQSAVSASSQADVVSGPKDTGTFPNLNIAPQNAAPQFTNDQKNAKLAELKAEKAASERAGGTVHPVSQAELNKIARTHGPDTLKQIEGKCDPALDPSCK